MWMGQAAPRVRVAAVGIAAVLLSAPVFAEQSGTVPLRVDTGGLSAASGTPVAGGVPFPMGAVATVDHLRLQTTQGSEVPANYRLLASWPDGSVKAALISVVPSVSSGSYGGLVLAYGPTVRHATTGPVQVAQDAQSLTITTDVLKLKFSKSKFTILDQAWTDANGDGTFASGEQWLSAPADLIVVDRKSGGTFRSSLWTSGDGYAPQLIESGPQKVTVLLSGRLKGADGAQTVDGDSTLVQANVWLSVYGGSSLVHVQTTVIDTKSRNTETFSSKVMDLDGIALELPTTLTQASYAAGGDGGTVHQGSVGGGAFLLQDANATFGTDEFTYNFFYNGVGSGAQAPGWMDASSGSRGLLMGLRHFWQTFPHKFVVDDTGVVRMEFLPAGASTSFWTVYPGVGKTYEGFLDLHAGGYATAVKQRAELALRPPLLVAEPSWYAATEALGPFAPASALSGHWEAQVANQYKCTVLRTGCSIRNQVFGQRDFGDYQLGTGTKSTGQKFPEYGDQHYEDGHAALIQFARTGDRNWFDFAAAAARHHYDLDVMHTQNPPRFPGYPPGMIHWHGTSEHEGVNIEFGHVVPGGLDEYYLLTGDPRALEVLREQADFIEHWARSGRGRIAPEKSGDGVGLEEYERVGAWTLYTVLKAYEVTGDPKYWEGASILVKNTIDWWKMPQDHIVFDSRPLDLTQPPKDQAVYYQRSDWTQGTGYPLPTLRVANCPQSSAPISNYAYQTHAPIGWMGGLLQTALIRYYQDLQRRGGSYSGSVQYRGTSTPIAITAAEMREMFIQMLNMIVEHNYLGAPKHPSKYPWLKDLDYNHFVYSVCPGRDPRVEDGGQYLQWPLLFVSSFSQSEVSSRWQASWPQIQAKWREIAQMQYSRLIVNKPGALTGYNGVPNMWNMPFAVAKLETLGLLDDLPTPPPPSSGGTSSGSSSGGSSTPPPPPPSSVPAYRVAVNDGNPFITSPLVELTLAAPSTAVEMNLSATGLGQGAWQPFAPEVHGFALPSGSGAKTLYAQFRDGGGTILASLTKPLVLVQPGFSGSVTLVLNEADDTYVFSNQASANFATQTTLTAGKYDAGYDNIALLRFELPTLLPGMTATVQSGALEVYLTENTRNTSQDISPYEPTSDWAEDAVTWNSRPSLSSGAIGSAVRFTGRTEVNRWKIFPLTLSVVQRWMQDPAAVRGVALMGVGTPGLTSVKVVSSESFSGSADKRPRLALNLQVAMSLSDPTPPVISGLQAVGVGEAAATVQWTTNEPADGLVEYGLTTNYGSAAPAQTSLSTDHAVALSGLVSRTTYHARATSRDAAGNQTVSGDLVFTTTGPVPGDLNRDGQITLSDLTALIGQLLGLSPVTPETADVNGDGRVTIADVQALSNKL
jgi:hypothetical protein